MPNSRGGRGQRRPLAWLHIFLGLPASSWYSALRPLRLLGGTNLQTTRSVQTSPTLARRWRGRLTTASAARPPRSSDWAPLPLGISRPWRGRRRRVASRRRTAALLPLLSATPGCSPFLGHAGPVLRDDGRDLRTRGLGHIGPGPGCAAASVSWQLVGPSWSSVPGCPLALSRDCAAAGPLPPY
jgi:hypothetical protein